VLLGAVGAPEFDHEPSERRPERGLLEIRKRLGVFANLRPARLYPALVDLSPVRRERVAGTDLLIVRELTGGIYYGTPRGITDGDDPRATNTMLYHRSEIVRVARTAFRLARRRRKKLTSVDKANVLENSQLWRRTVSEVAAEFPDVVLNHLLVDNCAMQLVLSPAQFDVLLTENLFGDILSDEAAVLAGSIGMLASASLGEPRANGIPAGLYEPVHGSAPDIAGKGMANPLGAIGSIGMMLRYSFGLEAEAAAVESAIGQVLAAGVLTADLRPTGPPASTAAVSKAVCEFITQA
jgi:3-isopropylmalate dehydrogenase